MDSWCIYVDQSLCYCDMPNRYIDVNTGYQFLVIHEDKKTRSQPKEKIRKQDPNQNYQKEFGDKCLKSYKKKNWREHCHGKSYYTVDHIIDTL